jgi:predicted LPLAT superfamily acyltransferase
MAINPVLKGAYRDWTRAPERGTSRLLTLITTIARWLPRRVVTLLLYPIVAYFVTFSPRQVVASRQFLERAMARSPRWSDVFAHYMTFARMVLDRVYWLSRKDPRIPVRVHGAEGIEALHANCGKGLIILGAHLGSFEALRGAGGRVSGRRIRPVMYVANARKMQEVLDAINPDLVGDVIFAGRPGTMLEIREAIEHGDIVGILADRSPFADRTVHVPFLGQLAPFPVGAYRLAALLDAPTVFACAVLDGPGYEIFFEPLNTPAVGEWRADREEYVRVQAARFAANLEKYARAYPLNWFNFYDFWHGSASSPGPHASDVGSTGEAG